MILIIDFYDSFTYNLQNELYQMRLDSKVLPFDQVNQDILNHYKVLVLGPGPGHPQEYQHKLPWLKWLIQNKKVMGICLGHQLILQDFGFSVVRDNHPKHGTTEMITIPPWKHFNPIFHGVQTSVQRYNSLSVKINDKKRRLLEQTGNLFFEKKQVCQMAGGNNWLSYQFHPESVGTMCPQIFFEPLKNFVYT
jgi:anthranilate/para-aminobenzoate synthase component II